MQRHSLWWGGSELWYLRAWLDLCALILTPCDLRGSLHPAPNPPHPSPALCKTGMLTAPPYRSRLFNNHLLNTYYVLCICRGTVPPGSPGDFAYIQIACLGKGLSPSETESGLDTLGYPWIAENRRLVSCCEAPYSSLGRRFPSPPEFWYEVGLYSAPLRIELQDTKLLSCDLDWAPQQRDVP